MRDVTLPVCILMFGDGVVPWFQPMVRDYQDGHWYLGEDFAFCERARLAGYRIFADTSIRLWHHGAYGYSWEDAGSEVRRYASYEFTVSDSAIP